MRLGVGNCCRYQFAFPYIFRTTVEWSGIYPGYRTIVDQKMETGKSSGKASCVIQGGQAYAVRQLSWASFFVSIQRTVTTLPEFWYQDKPVFRPQKLELYCVCRLKSLLKNTSAALGNMYEALNMIDPVYSPETLHLKCAILKPGISEPRNRSKDILVPCFNHLALLIRLVHLDFRENCLNQFYFIVFDIEFEYHYGNHISKSRISDNFGVLLW